MNENKININFLITINLRTFTNFYYISNYENSDNPYFNKKY